MCVCVGVCVCGCFFFFLGGVPEGLNQSVCPFESHSVTKTDTACDIFLLNILTVIHKHKNAGFISVPGI